MLAFPMSSCNLCPFKVPPRNTAEEAVSILRLLSASQFRALLVASAFSCADHNAF